MTSTRLPGKVLLSILERPLLQYLIDRIRVSKEVGLLVATTTNVTDDPIVQLCEQNRVQYFRGSEHDVLQRYFLAAESVNADPVIRITSDCPLMDLAVILDCLKLYGNQGLFDYVSNCEKRTYPRGYDTEIFSFKSLKEAQEQSTEAYEHEHVTPYIFRHAPESRRAHQLLQDKDYSSYRLTVDTKEDFELIRRIIEELYPVKPNFQLADVVAVLSAHPDWVEINRHIEQKC